MRTGREAGARGKLSGSAEPWVGWGTVGGGSSAGVKIGFRCGASHSAIRRLWTRGSSWGRFCGYARIDQTMNTYAHVMPHIQADAFGRFCRRLSQG